MPEPPDDSFAQRVLQTCLRIPFGRVCTYGAIARHCGSPQASRQVGWILNKAGGAHGALPAHRVVNRHGRLTGKAAFPGAQTMRQLLEEEGVRVEDDQVIDFDKLLWTPENPA